MSRSRLVRLNAPTPVVEAILDVWREMGRQSEMIVYGRSMEPTIRRGARVRVDHSLESIRLGDVIVFKNGDHLTAHRVVEIRRDESGGIRYVTRGDLNDYHDGEVEERFVVGRVLEVLDGDPHPPPGFDPNTAKEGT
ncbi:MAG TPA: signal peptidase I [Thermoanaerobaculia bacterium]|nr:signal peptidase I [Thermoanaerobaculia bacterium]